MVVLVLHSFIKEALARVRVEITVEVEYSRMY